MLYVALKSFQVEAPGGMKTIPKGTKLEVFNQKKAKALVARGILEPIIKSPNSLELERKIKSWGCENCQMFLEEDLFCFVPGAQSQVVNVRFLRGCPQKDKEILKAIQAGRHLDWMI